MNKYSTIILKYVKLYSICILVFYAAMILVYTIPNSWVMDNVTRSLTFLEEEGENHSILTNDMPAILDNVTDTTMLKLAMDEGNEKLGPLSNSLFNNGYARYWQGYQVVLRPLLILLSYSQIRYLNMAIFFLTLGLTFSLYKEKLGIGTAVSFSFSLTAIYALTIPFCLQYSTAYYVMIAAVCYILKKE